MQSRVKAVKTLLLSFSVALKCYYWRFRLFNSHLLKLLQLHVSFIKKSEKQNVQQPAYDELKSVTIQQQDNLWSLQFLLRPR